MNIKQFITIVGLIVFTNSVNAQANLLEKAITLNDGINRTGPLLKNIKDIIGKRKKNDSKKAITEVTISNATYELVSSLADSLEFIGPMKVESWDFDNGIGKLKISHTCTSKELGDLLQQHKFRIKGRADGKIALEGI
jgi:hypothetical protein